MVKTQRQALGSFLRDRREATEPEAVGLVTEGRRRTPGLRREELAQLGGVSMTWYTWLEQGRDIKASRQVIERLAVALRMTPAERAHLNTLAGLSLLSPVGRGEVDATLVRLLKTLEPNPAYIINPWYDLLAYNRPYAGLLPVERAPANERNTLWLAATDRDVQAMLADWTLDVRPMLGQLRANLARYADDPRGLEVLEALLAASPRVATLWKQQRVVRFESRRKRVTHPRLGALEFDFVKLAVAGDEALSVMVYLPGDAATAKRFLNLAP